jgi:hypothetical protein
MSDGTSFTLMLSFKAIVLLARRPLLSFASFTLHRHAQAPFEFSDASSWRISLRGKRSVSVAGM